MSGTNVYDLIEELNAHQHAALLSPVTAKHRETRTYTVTPTSAGRTVRELLTATKYDRERVSALVPAPVLLSALWTPALGEKLLAAAKKRCRTPAEFAELTGVSLHTLRRWARAVRSPRFDLLEGAVAALEMDLDELLALAEWPPQDAVEYGHTLQAYWFRSVRHDLGNTLAGMARLLGVSAFVYTSWERGVSAVSAEAGERALAGLAEIGVHCTLAQLQAMRAPEPAEESQTAFGALLGSGRMARRMSRRAAAIALDAPRSVIKSWESGMSMPSAPEIPALLSLLEVSVDDATEALLADRPDRRRDRGAWVDARRRALGINRRALAAHLGVHYNELSKWNSGRASVPERHSAALAEMLAVPVGVVESFPAQSNTIYVVFGRAAKERRLELGLGQREVAALAGLTQVEVSAAESGSVAPRVFERLNVALAA